MTEQIRWICGIATIFGQRTHDGRIWRREEFDGWLRLRMSVPLRLDHAPVAIEPSGMVILDIGMARRFCPVTAPVDGPLCLAEIDQDPWGAALLEDL
ncbi:MAG: hypothetical protein K0S98_1327 [Propionibacteriaceae bacterium]|nr:hypothetical protein [Propionibacteriaceae bacterium]